MNKWIGFRNTCINVSPWDLDAVTDWWIRTHTFCLNNECLTKYLKINEFVHCFLKQKMRKSFSQRTTNEHGHWTSKSFLIRHSYWGYRCKSDIATYAWRVTWNYAYSSFNSQLESPSPLNANAITPNYCRTHWNLSWEWSTFPFMNMRFIYPFSNLQDLSPFALFFLNCSFKRDRLYS